MNRDNGVSESQLAQLDAAGSLVPVNQTLTINPSIRPAGAPPSPSVQPPNFSGTLPQNLQYTPDIERTTYGPTVPTFRLMPVGPGGIPSQVAAAQSTAQKVIDQNTFGKAALLSMPTNVFQVIGGKPLTSNGQNILVSFQPQLANTFFAGPLTTNSQATFDKAVTGSASNSATASIGPTTPSSGNEFFVFVVSAATSVSGTPAFTPAAGWTQLQPTSGSSGQGLSWYNTSSTALTASVGLSPNADWVGALLLFYASGTPSVVQSKYHATNLGPGSYTIAFTSNTTAGNGIFLFIEDLNTVSNPTYSLVSDTGSNNFVQIARVAQHGGFGLRETVTVFYAEKIAGGADTVSFTQTGGAGGQGMAWIAEISGLISLSQVPTFRHIQPLDLQFSVFGPSGPNHSVGAVPDPGSVAGTTRFLREDATWDVAGSSTEVNGSAITGTIANFNDTTPAASAGTANIKWQADSSTPATNISAYLPTFVASGASHKPGAVPDPGASAGSTKFLREDATFAVPPGSYSPANQSVSVNGVEYSDDYIFTCNAEPQVTVNGS